MSGQGKKISFTSPSGIFVDEEGVRLGTAKELNFVGPDVTVTLNAAGVATITIADAIGSIPVNNCVFLMENGNDLTGLAQRYDFPFLSLQAAITAATALAPSATNVITIVAYPGTYVGTANVPSFVNIVSAVPRAMCFNDVSYASVFSQRGGAKGPVYFTGTITQIGANCCMYGFNCDALDITVANTNSSYSSIVVTGVCSNSNLIDAGKWYDAHASQFLGDLDSLDGTYLYCTGGANSFAGSATISSGAISGRLYKCLGTTNCFSSSNIDGGTISGTLEYCRASGARSFSSSVVDGGIISGTIRYCVGTTFAFGAGGTNPAASGGTLSGTIENCIAGSDSYFVGIDIGGTISATGVIRNCIAGDRSFGRGSIAGGNITGRIEECTAGLDSYVYGGVTGGNIAGTIINCVGGLNSFAAGGITGGNISGTIRDCIMGLNTLAYGGSQGGIITGTIKNCIAGANSYAAGGVNGGTISGSIISSSAPAGSSAFAQGPTAAANGNITSTGVLKDIEYENTTGMNKVVVAGKLIRCRIRATGANEIAVVVAAGALIEYCDIKGTGTANSIGVVPASTPSVDVRNSNLFGKGYDAAIILLTGTPYNTDDANSIF